jgi:hypothetical protein
MLHAVIAAAVLGVISTLGDYVWAVMHIRHRVIYGLVHGAVICLFIGAAIGAREGRIGRGIAVGPLIGVLAAALFYVLAPWLRYSAMFPAWMFFWICFAVLQFYLRGEGALGIAIARGVVAAVLSGAAFYAISGIWTRPSPGGPDYLRNLWSWTVAFLPGFAALFVGVRSRFSQSSVSASTQVIR